MTYKPGASAKLHNHPALPSCAMVAVEDGDPAAGPSVIRIHAQPGCVVPWHWHTANERLIVVRGSAQVEMKGMPPQALTPGDFAALPAKHVHQFTALTEVEMFTLPDAAFDIHYVGQDASEISFADALKAVHEAPGSGK